MCHEARMTRGQYSHDKEYPRDRWLWSELQPCNVRKVSGWKILLGPAKWCLAGAAHCLNELIWSPSSPPWHHPRARLLPPSAVASHRAIHCLWIVFDAIIAPASFVTCPTSSGVDDHPTSRSTILWLQRCSHQRKLGQLFKLLH